MFESIKAAVTARQAAESFGLTVNRSGMAALSPLFVGLVQAAFYEEITNPTIPTISRLPARGVFCSKCGNAYPSEDAQFCSVCGTPRF